MPSYIQNIQTANPQHRHMQKDTVHFMQEFLKLDDLESHQLAVLYRATGIQERFSVVSDFSNGRIPSFFSYNGHTPSTNERMKIYRDEAAPLAGMAAEACFEEVALSASKVTHLITVSCTGLYAPGLDIDLIYRLGLKEDVSRTCINFMGCQGAINGLKMADSIARSNPDALILLVCVELCSLHLQRKKDPDSMLSASLFGDGAAAALISAIPGGKSLEITQFLSGIEPTGHEDMTWNIGDFGFEMKLTDQVPAHVGNALGRLLDRLPKGLQQVDYYAVHPGGKKILETVANLLDLGQNALAPSYDVLKNFGNMSSPTFLFVLKALWSNLGVSNTNKNILGLSFGPGISMESVLLKVRDDG